ncbi:MAG: NAD-dependent dehydratase [Omnitrophica bacterium RIFCSPLOWO2_12_FULL_44_17]|uniref:NAD-dependent dehydratase n=1 Tax=Candidatus Danuiimicrobium aquiferis TaxID=1801832 RepID=A0A1G1KR83_9BACT|nr:MAG: NAD-dependent dehydratase [Omnitrophica bacterium RIFCSPHIGHO2_02_FULL_45_28]OGW91087.1 MAG: NAD-dependent dehydratase [Omnitrophica bacterium RIFCSPHIGHO2_12_FULL_44_12]OGW95059.1 MAG: NAD-dependent dehydratase [Omnitrophica bacterium RIFCSPLOWO2_12_FULL_44_17]OGX02979.1 MAG: NAD-dependent dehydratase [Omnitrophica bacterium RIFCSPLOWO2_02_FULL_44_11]
MDRKSLVTGAGGFIGHHLVSFLKSKGQYVIGVDRKRPEFEPTKADQFILHDIRHQTKEWQKLFEGVDDVWALAAEMGGMGFISYNHAMIMRDNVTININTLEAARQAGVKRYLYTSSACIYPEYLQEVTNVKALTEEMAYPAKPQDGYGWEKLYTEKLCEYYQQEFGMDIRIVRFHNMYGPLGTWRGGREKAPAALCRKVAEAILKKQDYIEIWGDGEQTRTFCYIDDCIKGLNLIMESGYKKPINLGRDEMVSINQLADIVMKVAGVSLQKVHIVGPQGVRGRNSDNLLCKKVLNGWAPEIDLKEGLRTTYQWIHKQLV